MARRAAAARGGLFGDAEPEAKAAPASYRANIDGGSRGNPGPASYGVVVRDGRDEIVAQLKKYIGRATNNVAEYYGLIAALDYAQSHGLRNLQIESDSELQAGENLLFDLRYRFGGPHAPDFRGRLVVLRMPYRSLRKELNNIVSRFSYLVFLKKART